MLTRGLLAVDPFVRMVEEMDRIFGGMAGPAQPVLGISPLFNIWQDERSVHAEVELPGLSLSDVEVFATGNTLTIKGRRQAVRPEGAAVIRAERRSGEFERTVELPTEIDVEGVTAALVNGVLTVTMPKSQAVMPRRIEVKAA